MSQDPKVKTEEHLDWIKLTTISNNQPSILSTWDKI